MYRTKHSIQGNYSIVSTLYMYCTSYMYMSVHQMLEITYNDVVDHLGVVVLDGLVEEEQAHGVEDGNQRHEQLKDSVRMKSFKDDGID